MSADRFQFNPLVQSVTLRGFVNSNMPQNSIQYVSYRDHKISRCYSFESLEWLFHLCHLRNVYVRHAENDRDGEKHIHRYFVDGYIEETNTVLEYHGCFYHG